MPKGKAKRQGPQEDKDMKTFKTTKGIEIHAIRREGESWTWNVKELILGRIYEDGSFGKCIRIYNDKNGIFQMEFLKGCDIAYTFLPECTELLDFMKEGIVGSTLGIIADYLMRKGWTEVTEK